MFASQAHLSAILRKNSFSFGYSSERRYANNYRWIYRPDGNLLTELVDLASCRTSLL